MVLQKEKVLEVVKRLSKNSDDEKVRLTEYVDSMKKENFVQEESIAVLDKLIDAGLVDLDRFFNVSIPD